MPRTAQPSSHSGSPETSRLEALRVAGLLLLCFVVFVPGSATRAVWDVDEGLHATTSKDMVLSGDWITPRFNDEPFFDKPPLLTWLVALSFSILGFTELAARLPAILVGTATVLITYGFGRRMFGGTAAFLGAAALATSVEHAVLSRTIVHDISLSLFVTLALLSFYRAYAEERHRGRFLILAYASMGVAVLAKGPVGLVLPVAIIGIFLLARRDLGFVRKAMPVVGVIVVLAVAAPWYVLISLRNESYLEYFLLQKNLGSFMSAESRHPEPIYHYIPALLGGFFPWSLFLPLALVRWFQRRKEADPARLYTLIWIGFIFFFFTLATSKLETYILPLFPAAALLVGDLWARVWNAPERRPSLGMLVSYALLIATFVGVIVLVWTRLAEHRDVRIDLHQPVGITVTVIGAASSLLIILFLATKSYRALFGTTTAGIVALILLFSLVIAPALEPFQSAKNIARELDGLLPPGEKMTFYHGLLSSALFYTDRKARELRGRPALEEYLGNAGALCVIDRDYMGGIDGLEEIQSPFRIVREHGPKMIIEGLGAPANR
jgi:4-amino-4-deoxy-L-arabinose transferase-like glycosyltransferase